MSALDFFVDFALNGRIQGVGLNSTPEMWTEDLGTDYIDDKSKNGKRLRRDYGIVELGFVRKNGLWSCFLISLQAYRLWRYADCVPQKYLDGYGEVPRSIQFEDVRNALRVHGCEPQLIADDNGADTARYYVPPVNVLIAVVAGEAEQLNDLSAGSIWSMHLSEDSGAWARPRQR